MGIPTSTPTKVSKTEFSGDDRPRCRVIWAPAKGGWSEPALFECLAHGFRVRSTAPRGLLAAGDKSGTSEKRFYRGLIATADARLDAHLERLKRATKAPKPARKR
jgi:hypothetical protein